MPFRPDFGANVVTLKLPTCGSTKLVFTLVADTCVFCQQQSLVLFHREPGTKGHHTTGFTIATKFDALQPVAAGIARDDSSLSSHLRPLCAAISQHWTS